MYATISTRCCLTIAILLFAFTSRAARADEPIYVVDNYKSALDRMTQEVARQLEKNPLLLIWCFDESESMKDDQHEIRVRLGRIYDELRGIEGIEADAVLSAVCSFGSDFHWLTREPTGDVKKLQHAIDAIQIDKSGKELVSSAIGQAISHGRKWTQESKRRMMVCVVTDESGDPADHLKMLEPAITIAKENQCPVYFFGRQANFGVPYGYLRWRHPQTKRFHWLVIDRGPETGVLQMLQTNGFERRRDAISSGFGPYTQLRMVRETGGVFFQLPSLETNLGAREKPYPIEAMRNYHPDWRSQAEILADRDRSLLRTQLCTVIADLNPYDPKIAQSVVLKTSFSAKPNQFPMQVAVAKKKVLFYLQRLRDAEQALAALEAQRDAETSGRWRASYDLTRAHLVTYQARVRAYEVELAATLEEPKSAPLTRGKLQLTSWRIVPSRAASDPESERLAERATALLREVIAAHPDTPWARQADWELKRGFGMTLRPHYEPPQVKVPQPIRPPVL